VWNLFWFDVLTPPVFVAGSTRLGATHDIDFGASFLIAPRLCGDMDGTSPVS
jgi:hypothetical protein